MMEIGLLVVGLSFAGLHTLVCYRLFGLVATLVSLRQGSSGLKSVRPIKDGTYMQVVHI